MQNLLNSHHTISTFPSRKPAMLDQGNCELTLCMPYRCRKPLLLEIIIFQLPSTIMATSPIMPNAVMFATGCCTTLRQTMTNTSQHAFKSSRGEAEGTNLSVRGFARPHLSHRLVSWVFVHPRSARKRKPHQTMR